MLEIGSSYTKTIIADEQIIRQIADVSGDRNPIHLDEEYARGTKVGKRIAHALFCINGISMVIGNYFPGEGTILVSQKFRYLYPVFIDDVIEIIIEVAKILSKNRYLLNTVCRNQMGKIVLEGESVVVWEKKLH